MKRFSYAWIVAMVIGLAHCKHDVMSTDEGHAHLHQFIGNKNYKCDVNPERVDGLLLKYGKYMTGHSDLKQRAGEVLSRMPQELLTFVYDTYKVPTNLQGFGGGGLTGYKGSAAMRTPTFINTGVRGSSYWDPYPHEFGHASHGYFQRIHKGFNKDLTNARSYALSNEATYIKTYAKKNIAEFWAEGFDHYTCSDEARQAMREKTPNTYLFFHNYLGPLLEGMTAKVVPDLSQARTVTEEPFKRVSPNMDSKACPTGYKKIDGRWCEGTANGQVIGSSNKQWYEYITYVTVGREYYLTIQDVNTKEILSRVNYFALANVAEK